MIVKRHLPHPYLHWVFSLTEWNKLSPPTYQAKEVSHFHQHFSAVISIFILMAIAFLLWPMYLYLCLFQKTVGIQNNCVIGKSQWSSYRFCKIALLSFGGFVLFFVKHLCIACFVLCVILQAGTFLPQENTSLFWNLLRMSHTLYLQVNFRLVILRTKTKCSGGWTKASKSFGAGFLSLWPKSIHWACCHPVELTVSCSSCPIPAHGRLQCLWGWQVLLPVVYVPQVSGSRNLYWMKEWMNACMSRGIWVNE